MLVAKMGVTKLFQRLTALNPTIKINIKGQLVRYYSLFLKLWCIQLISVLDKIIVMKIWSVCIMKYAHMFFPKILISEIHWTKSLLLEHK